MSAVDTFGLKVSPLNMRALTPFHPHELPIQVSASLIVQDRELYFQYELNDPERLVLDGLTPGEWDSWARADGLWQSTCFEAFWGEPGRSGYWELNLSPARRLWNLYSFTDYRAPQPPQASQDYVLSRIKTGEGWLEARLTAASPLPRIEASLCAVIKTAASTFYCSGKHAASKPDFHARGSFTPVSRNEGTW